MNSSTVPVGQKIKTIRCVRGWSQSKLARMIGLSQNFLSDVETGHKDRPAVVEAIERAIGFKFDADEVEIAFGILRNNTASFAQVQAALACLEDRHG